MQERQARPDKAGQEKGMLSKDRNNEPLLLAFFNAISWSLPEDPSSATTAESICIGVMSEAKPRRSSERGSMVYLWYSSG